MPAGALSPEALPTPPAWFGKLSMLGDFAHRRLAPELVQRLDAWLAGWVVDSRRRLGKRWLEAYLTAPVLRFAWAPGVLGPTAWCGVLMPSCDSAGRYFPLWVAEPCAAAAARRAAWFDAVEAAATATLDDGAAVDAFEERLAEACRRCDASAAAPTAGDGAAALSHWWVRTGDGRDGTVTVLRALPDADAVTRLLLERPAA